MVRFLIIVMLGFNVMAQEKCDYYPNYLNGNDVIIGKIKDYIDDYKYKYSSYLDSYVDLVIRNIGGVKVYTIGYSFIFNDEILDEVNSIKKYNDVNVFIFDLNNSKKIKEDKILMYLKKEYSGLYQDYINTNSWSLENLVHGVPYRKFSFKGNKLIKEEEFTD